MNLIEDNLLQTRGTLTRRDREICNKTLAVVSLQFYSREGGGGCGGFKKNKLKPSLVKLQAALARLEDPWCIDNKWNELSTMVQS